MAELRENCIEWVTGQETVSVTLSQGRMISKVRRLAEKHPEKVSILSENEDGSIFAHLPLSALKLSIISHDLTEEQRQKMRDRLQKSRE